MSSSDDQWLFPLGQIVATPRALHILRIQKIPLARLLDRHRSGDWGILPIPDAAANEASVKKGGMILSRYRVSPMEMVWIITEADRSTTAVLLPAEY
ncbi:hypothetical protein [Cupriavidus agavae]|uniref:Type I restriction endonuclease subunit M n=1 Tax=Cupriavidus agavae TaxID=1001822 RepID=A0A4Q7RZA3_9BURK|nr:hypothetical protein [Cupriavidus agavae]RZT38390.1 hypothetical protein EV147_2856 [Cupriavidus agavae]